MIKFGTRKQGNGKRSRGHNKFSRGTKAMKNFEGSKLSMRVGKWTEISIRAEHLFRFLHSNIGRPVDKVFSEFIARCDKSIYNPKETFYDWIEKKEEIDPRWGGFYVTNGILNYKKRKREHNKKKPSFYDTCLQFNRKNFPDNNTLKLVCNKSVRNGLTLLGKFYVLTNYREGIVLKNVFVRDVSSFAGFFNFKTTDVLGIGRYLYKRLIMSEKGTYMSIEPSNISPRGTTSNHNVFEFIIKEE